MLKIKTWLNGRLLLLETVVSEVKREKRAGKTISPFEYVELKELCHELYYTVRIGTKLSETLKITVQNVQRRYNLTQLIQNEAWRDKFKEDSNIFDSGF